MKVGKKGKVAVKPNISRTIKKNKMKANITSSLKTKSKRQHISKTGPITINTSKSSPKPVQKKIKKKQSLENGKNISKSKSNLKKVTKKPHEKDIEKLKEIDPEFYDFLKKNDKQLLEFNLYDSDDSDEEEEEDQEDKQQQQRKKLAEGLSDSDDDDDDDEEVGEEENNSFETDEGKCHKPSCDDLEVASDESDFEDDEGMLAVAGTQKVTLSLLRQWQMELEKPNVSIDIVRKVIQAFNSALASISNDETVSKHTTFKVVGAATFNAVIQLCVLHLQPAVLHIVGLTKHPNTPLHKSKKWTRIRSCLRYYFMDLVRLIEEVSSPNILCVLLKHLHQMAAMIASFTSAGKVILKRLIVLWATADETVRVLAFLCILKITRTQQVSMLNHVLKAMYLSYVRNSKFVSPNTLPCINFMRRSLVEMFALDMNVSYQHAFLYIRQLAIHLRNAVILKKKNSFQSVYNWQYMNSLRLWVDLLGTATPTKQLQPLIYPLVTIITGVIKLIPTAQYFPLRFHCVQSLIALSKATHTFIPILPFILEVLRSKTFQRKHSIVSMKPMQFTCVLRLNKSQLCENAFRDEVVEQVCGLTLEYLAHESSSFAYCDLIVSAVVALKQYLKECKNANYSRKIKQLLEKIQENARFIENERRKVTFGLKDTAQIQAWENQVRNKSTPLDIYFNSWMKTHETKKRRQAINSGNISDYNLPLIKRKQQNSATAMKKDKEPVELFPSDDDDEDLIASELEADNVMMMEENKDESLLDADEKSSKTATRQHKKSSSKKIAAKKDASDDPGLDIPLEEQFDDAIDIVQDLDLDDW